LKNCHHERRFFALKPARDDNSNCSPMLIIAIDTSGRHGSVALCRGDARGSEVLQLTPLEGGTYSARLIPTLAEILQRASASRNDLDGFAVVTGPGSFTGLRVGLATVKGLCEVLQKPLATVSMLEAVALIHGSSENPATAVLDAGRGEIYVGDYRVSSAGATAIREYITKLDDFPGSRGTDSELLTPDVSVSDVLHDKNVHVRLVAPVQAREIGLIGLRKLSTGDVTDHATVDVNYIRRSDAEIFFAPKR
jgi:tRNA threonylcarbamoyladenosine biosynthesis protein TsaB